MKKVTAILLAVLLLFAAVSCGRADSAKKHEEETISADKSEFISLWRNDDESGALVYYINFISEEEYAADMFDVFSKGTWEIVGDELQITYIDYSAKTSRTDCYPFRLKSDTLSLCLSAGTPEETWVEFYRALDNR